MVHLMALVDALRVCTSSQRKIHLVYHPCTPVLLQLRLHFGECAKQLEPSPLAPRHLHRTPTHYEKPLSHYPTLPSPPQTSPLDPHSWLWPHSNPPLIYRTSSVHFIIPLLHLNAHLPYLVIWLPLYPPLEHLMCTWDILEQLLEVDAFVP